MTATDTSQASNPGWLLDEIASAGRENLDAAHVARNDGREDAGGSAEVALLREAGLGAGSVVVDLGAGTGQFTLAAARSAAGWSPSTSRRPDVVVGQNPAWTTSTLLSRWAVTWLLEAMMDRAGFAVENALYSEDGIFDRYLLRAI